ncbi:MAG: 2-hydroxyglutaryl-CoA dehydratase [Candidatus Syntrophosphaera sp.]|nr:2-hydroxyglutaryl-CoA dehydratase [Candidatus Syntrophosphaera sp.]
MTTLGIDIGSRNTKIVIFDPGQQKILFSGWSGTDVNPLVSLQRLLDEALRQTGSSSFAATGCTGYGRKLYQQPARIVSEISCHAAGVLFSHPEAKTIIDIGGQDSKIITLGEDGRVRDFVMNDKCAAGTGRFLEMTALRLECPLEELSRLAEQATQEPRISSTCVVFAETEIIGLIAQNESAANIARAVHESIAGRVLIQLSSLEFHPPVVFTGGVAQNSDLANCLAQRLGMEIAVPPDPEITGALGAALMVAR